RSSRFGGCPARLSAKVAPVTLEGGTSTWVVKVFSRTRTHNRFPTQLLGTLIKGKAVDNRPDVQSRLVNMVSVGGALKKITQLFLIVS
ncbi:hypothetical protein GN958_ATG15644, partial [Phytophthora infestans]